MRSDWNETSYLLGEGWHSLEPQHVWSAATAKLALPVPDNCEATRCNAVLKFATFGASLKRPVPIIFSGREDTWVWREQITAISEEVTRSEEHTSELQSLMRISYAVFCLKKKKKYNDQMHQTI